MNNNLIITDKAVLGKNEVGMMLQHIRAYANERKYYEALLLACVLYRKISYVLTAIEERRLRLDAQTISALCDLGDSIRELTLELVGAEPQEVPPWIEERLAGRR